MDIVSDETRLDISGFGRHGNRTRVVVFHDRGTLALLAEASDNGFAKVPLDKFAVEALRDFLTKYLVTMEKETP